ncbi:Rrp15p-domain-containing protein [Anaeromyces robustus]|uniref:Rrp15p-domain-containing protein n=1 Tax=Anaeromyces robustus TaxID=1754192 RepID=A0A1Y1VSK4_9FUNG|nr:Rrp15p-domain-containing protein [Anaeromyces robustus]|eukprot:ORX64163.1 Rrp15p-domain-containing protein [Anaeromyces robustus]
MKRKFQDELEVENEEVKDLLKDNQGLLDNDNDSNYSDEDELNDEMSDDENEKNTDTQGRNIALASVMSRILNTDTNEKPILAKAKEIEQKIEDEKLDYKARKAITAERKKLEEKDRVIPDYTTFEYEKKLRKLATRGVVKLFNAIKTAQEKSNEVHTLVTNKKPKVEVAKKSFMDMLQESNKRKTETNEKTSNKKENSDSKEPAWNVFSDSYGMNASIKDWDKPEEEDNNDKSDIDEDFDDNSDGD